MPSLATLGALSARGFGQKIRKGGPTIQIKLWGAGGSSTWKDVSGCPHPNSGGAGGFVTFGSVLMSGSSGYTIGAGGAGGVVYGNVAVFPSTVGTYTIVVGSGTAAGSGVNGGNSAITGGAITANIVAVGGGAGGNGQSPTNLGGSYSANITAGAGGVGTNAYSTWATATSTGVGGYYAGGGGGGGSGGEGVPGMDRRALRERVFLQPDLGCELHDPAAACDHARRTQT